jgi:hypothetical protein
MDVVVFVGPTLPRDEAATILDAVYLPPAEQGSIVRAVRAHRPQAIILIDGAFGKVPAVRHKEILWTLATGISIFGAASMGAIRAAELSSIGMRGHGFIFRWYSLTAFADDDEVAVAMTPSELGAEPLSEALINIRLTLRRAERHGVFSGGQRHALEEIARTTHFVDRSYRGLVEGGRVQGRGSWDGAMDRFERWLARHAIDRKREDAIGLLARLAREPRLLQPPAIRPPFRLTEAWAYDLDAAGLFGDDIVGAEQSPPR